MRSATWPTMESTPANLDLVSQVRGSPQSQLTAAANANFSNLLVLLSQKAAAFADENHVFGKIQVSACRGLRWVCQNLMTLDRGFRHMSRV
jgi:hypothetical protein